MTRSGTHNTSWRTDMEENIASTFPIIDGNENIISTPSQSLASCTRNYIAELPMSQLLRIHISFITSVHLIISSRRKEHLSPNYISHPIISGRAGL
jgi:hypothetical protein